MKGRKEEKKGRNMGAGGRKKCLTIVFEEPNYA